MACPAGIGRLEVIDGAGHFPWLDTPDRTFEVVGDFVEGLSVGRRNTWR